MNISHTKTTLRFAAVTMLMIGSVVVLTSIFAPVGPKVPMVKETDVSNAQVNSPVATAPIDPESDLISLADVNLRRPLLALGPATNPAADFANDNSAGLRLTGTIIEPMHSFAIFTNSDGKTELKCVGDRAGAAEVTAISQDSVTLELYGRPLVLHTVKPSGITPAGL